MNMKENITELVKLGNLRNALKYSNTKPVIYDPNRVFENLQSNILNSYYLLSGKPLSEIAEMYCQRNGFEEMKQALMLQDEKKLDERIKELVVDIASNGIGKKKSYLLTHNKISFNKHLQNLLSQHGIYFYYSDDSFSVSTDFEERNRVVTLKSETVSFGDDLRSAASYNIAKDIIEIREQFISFSVHLMNAQLNNLGKINFDKIRNSSLKQFSEVREKCAKIDEIIEMLKFCLIQHEDSHRYIFNYFKENDSIPMLPKKYSNIDKYLSSLILAHPIYGELITDVNMLRKFEEMENEKKILYKKIYSSYLKFSLPSKIITIAPIVIDYIDRKKDYNSLKKIEEYSVNEILKDRKYLYRINKKILWNINNK